MCEIKSHQEMSPAAHIMPHLIAAKALRGTNLAESELHASIVLSLRSQTSANYTSDVSDDMCEIVDAKSS